MPASGEDPQRISDGGLPAISMADATGTRTYNVTVGGGESWDGDDRELTLTVSWASSGAPGFMQATVFRVRAHLVDGGGQVGTTVWSAAISGNSGTSGTRTLRFQADPLALSAANIRSGMVEVVLEVERDSGLLQWGPVTSRSNSGTPSATTNTWTRKYCRSRFPIVSHHVSNVGQGGATPGLWVYPDPIHMEVVTQTAFEAHNDSLGVRKADDASVRGQATGSSTSATRQVAFTANTDRVNDDFDVGLHNLRYFLTGGTFGGDGRHVLTDPLPAGWTRLDDNEARVVGLFDVDPRVTLSDFTLTNPASTVYNRGEPLEGSVERRNARNEDFQPLGADRLRVVNIGTDAVEEQVALTRTGVLLEFSGPFATASNNAPQDETGAEKRLRWDNTTAGGSGPTVDTAPVGFLSSLYDIATHLQTGGILNPPLDPDFAVTTRKTDEFGFYAVKVVNRRGQAVNSITGITLRFRDRGDVMPENTHTGQQTATRDGHPGYTPLQLWNSLPTGGWDLWADPNITHNGNVGLLPRAADPDPATFQLVHDTEGVAESSPLIFGRHRPLVRIGARRYHPV